MAAGPGTQTRRITISVDTQGSQELKALSDQLGGISANTKSLASSFNTLAGAAAAFLGGLGVRELASFSDQIQEINDHLLALTGSQASATQLLGQLGDVARSTDQSLQATADTYLKLGNSLKDAKLSSASLLDLTQTLLNSFRLSGTSAEGAASAVQNLAASFQLGGLKARDLRTILKENTVLAQALRQEFGNNLFSAATNGFISVSKVAQVLYKNMGDINQRAEQLGATFSESVTKGLDAFKVKVFEINQSLGLSGGFAGIMDVVIKNMGSFITLGAIIAASTLPAIILKVTELTVAMLALNPLALAITAGLAAGLTAVVAVFGNSSDIGDLINQLKVGFSEFKAILDDLIAKFYSFLAAIGQLAPGGSAASDAVAGYQALSKASKQAAQDARVHAQALEIEYDAQKALADQQAKTADAAGRHAADLGKLNAAFKPDLTPQQLLSQLNAAFNAGTVSVEQYNEKIQQVDIAGAQKKFRDGKIDLAALNDALQKFDTFKLNEQLKNGTITFEQFDDAIRNQHLEKMKQDLDAGRISLEQFNHELAGVQNQFSAGGAFRTGLQDYITSIGTSTQQVAHLITQTFSQLEDQLVNFVKTGTFNFAQFTQNVLDDLLRIIIRMSIIQPIAGGLLTAFTPTGPSASPSGGVGAFTPGGINAVPNAHGNIYDGGLKKFANGGVVSSPTTFGFGNGQQGLMGEKGPEAIIPLTRGSGGDLGVKASITPVTVNINNNNGSQVTQSESTGADGSKQIDILITAKVREGFATGKYDKQMKTNFGLNRKGS